GAGGQLDPHLAAAQPGVRPGDPQPSELVVNRRRPRAAPHRLDVVTHGPVVVVERRVAAAAVGVGGDVARVQLDGPVEVGQGEVAARGVDEGAVVVGRDEVRPQGQLGVVVGQGQGELAQGGVGEAAVVVGVGQPRRQADGLGEVGDGGGAVAPGGQAEAAIL